jgi:hypothetical protein
MENKDLSKYFGGTGITLEKLKKVMPTINVDGTTYKIENWLRECLVFDALTVNKSKVWIPYNVWERGVVTEVVWQKFNFKNYSFATEETKDWWIYEPYLKVQREGHEGEYYVYEVTFYKTWPRKTQMKELARRTGPKRKFLSQKAVAELKKQEAIANSQKKRQSVK